jgi:hypothetical protein
MISKICAIHGTGDSYVYQTFIPGKLDTMLMNAKALWRALTKKWFSPLSFSRAPKSSPNANAPAT